MIKLQNIKKEQYEETPNLLVKGLVSLPRKNLSINLNNFFNNYSGIMNIKSYIVADAIVDDEIDYYEFCFNIDFDKDNKKELAYLIKNKELNKKTIRRFRRFYHETYDKTPSSLDEILNYFKEDNELFDFLTGYYYDLRYSFHRYSKNILSSDNMYSGCFKRQGLMTYFFSSLKRVIDFDDLDYLEIDGIVEKNTCKMFNSLRKKIPNNDYLCELLKRKYAKSSFIRMFKNMGYGNIELVTTDNFLYAIRARKSESLSFRINENKEKHTEFLISQVY